MVSEEKILAFEAVRNSICLGARSINLALKVEVLTQHMAQVLNAKCQALLLFMDVTVQLKVVVS